MLKTDFHLHTREDPYDGDKGVCQVRYSARELIDKAAALEYDVLAITCHDYVLYTEEIVSYAKEKGILLIPSAELTVEGRHVLALNITNKDREGISSFADLKKLRKKDVVLIAPHPFHYISICLGSKLFEHMHLFDALELSYCSPMFYDINKKVKKVASRYDKSLVGNTDCHKLSHFGQTYSLIDAEKTIPSVLEALRQGKMQAHYTPLTFFQSLDSIFFLGFPRVYRFFNKKG